MRALLLAAAIASVAACKSPGPVAPPPEAERVWTALVEAGCVAPDDKGPRAIADEYVLKDDADAWLACMWAGGSTASCRAPCQ